VINYSNQTTRNKIFEDGTVHNSEFMHLIRIMDAWRTRNPRIFYWPYIRDCPDDIFCADQKRFYVRSAVLHGGDDEK